MEHHNDDVEDQDEQIMGILEYLTAVPEIHKS